MRMKLIALMAAGTFLASATHADGRERLAGAQGPSVLRMNAETLVLQSCGAVIETEMTDLGVRIHRGVNRLCVPAYGAAHPATTEIETDVDVTVITEPSYRRFGTSPYVLGAPRPRRY